MRSVHIVSKEYGRGTFTHCFPPTLAFRITSKASRLLAAGPVHCSSSAPVALSIARSLTSQPKLLCTISCNFAIESSVAVMLPDADFRS